VKILIIGSGGREHALVKAFKLSPQVGEVHVIPGSDGMSQEALCHPHISWNNFSSVIQFCNQFAIDFVMIGPEDPLVSGLTNALRQHGILTVGPDQEAAQLEGSKIFSKNFMKTAGVPTAFSIEVDSVSKTLEALPQFTAPYVLKADGLCAGKGVFICKNQDELKSAAELLFEKKIFGNAGSKALLEQFTPGFELSLLVLTNGQTFEILPIAQDHKRLNDHQTGPNTGGMGTVAPVQISETIKTQIIDQVIKPSIAEIEKRQMTYRGVLFIGLMMTDHGPSVLEYNTRLGDPETQVILPLLGNDVAELFYSLSKGKLESLKFKSLAATCVVKSSAGYPDSPSLGDPIEGLPFQDSPNGWVILSAVKKHGHQFVTNGGRVLGCVGIAETSKKATEEAYLIASKIKWKGCHQRNDIGAKSST
jgi:phosphoribosylamine--glycine ligase